MQALVEALPLHLDSYELMKWLVDKQESLLTPTCWKK